MTSFSSDFQTLIKRSYPLYFLYELLISLRINWKKWLCKILEGTQGIL